MGEMTTTVRANVKAWECDVMEHMNVQHYLARSAETLGQLRVLLGLPAGSTLRHRRERVLFMRELRNGASFEIATGILALGGHGLTTFNEMRNIDSGAIAARFVIDLDLIDAGSGASLPLTWPPAPRPSPGASPPRPTCGHRRNCASRRRGTGPPPRRGACSTPRAAPSNPGSATPAASSTRAFSWRAARMPSPTSSTTTA